jgi:ATP-binding protein involved in chromosome partitioning
MFEQLHIPILGIVENMSYFVAPDGAHHDLFGRGGAQAMAQKLGVPFLGEIPIYTDLRINSDSGQPERNYDQNPALAQALTQIVQNLAGQVSTRNLGDKAPELNIT